MESIHAGARLCLLGQEEQKVAGSHLCTPEGGVTRLQSLEVLQLDPTSQNSTSKDQVFKHMDTWYFTFVYIYINIV